MDMQQLINASFLRHVPDLLMAGLSYEQALTAARQRDDVLCEMLIDAARGEGATPHHEAAQQMIEQMRTRVYHTLRQK